MPIPENVTNKPKNDPVITYCSIAVLLPYHRDYEVMERDGPFRIMKRVFPVRSVGKIELVPVDEIRWIKGAANYVELHAQSGKYMHRETMQNVAEQLDSDVFLRIHRSAIVNLAHIKEINSELGRYSLLVLHDGTELKIGNAYRDQLFDALNL